jgi:BioD-like phosphotransacetylase family protein
LRVVLIFTTAGELSAISCVKSGSAAAWAPAASRSAAATIHPTKTGRQHTAIEHLFMVQFLRSHPVRHTATGGYQTIRAA